MVKSREKNKAPRSNMPTPVTLCSNDAKEEIEISRYKNKSENKDAKSRCREVSGVGMMPKRAVRRMST